MGVSGTRGKGFAAKPPEAVGASQDAGQTIYTTPPEEV
jgi:hypothetical protein